MKVAVSSSGPGLDAKVDIRFGRCPYFVIFDTETNEQANMTNTSAEAGSGAGIGAATAIAKSGATVVLTGNIGPNAARTLAELGIRVYQTQAGTVKEAIAAFAAGTCKEITAPTVAAKMGMGMGGGRGAGMGMRGGGGNRGRRGRG